MERGSFTPCLCDMMIQAGYAEEDFRIFQQHSVLLRLFPLVVKAFDTLGFERVENPVPPLGVEIKNDRFGLFNGGIGMLYQLQPHAVAWTTSANAMERDDVLFFWCHELAHAIQPETFFLENAYTGAGFDIDTYITNPIEEQANKAALLVAHDFSLSKDELENTYAEFCVRLKANHKAA